MLRIIGPSELMWNQLVRSNYFFFSGQRSARDEGGRAGPDERKFERERAEINNKIKELENKLVSSKTWYLQAFQVAIQVLVPFRVQSNVLSGYISIRTSVGTIVLCASISTCLHGLIVQLI